MKIRIIIIAAVLVVLAVILFKIGTIDDKTGGWNEPKNFKTCSNLLKTQIPSYSDSIYHNWWTGGTQEWKCWTKFNIPKEDINQFMDQEINSKQKEIAIGINRFKFSQCFDGIGHRPVWFNSKSELKGICIRSYFLGRLSSITWIDTTKQIVYLFNN
jgi:hypothetical protein